MVFLTWFPLKCGIFPVDFLIVEDKTVLFMFQRSRPPPLVYDRLFDVLTKMEDAFGWNSSTECPLSFFHKKGVRARHLRGEPVGVASRWHCEMADNKKRI